MNCGGCLRLCNVIFFIVFFTVRGQNNGLFFDFSYIWPEKSKTGKCNSIVKLIEIKEKYNFLGILNKILEQQL